MCDDWLLRGNSETGDVVPEISVNRTDLDTYRSMLLSFSAKDHRNWKMKVAEQLEKFDGN